MKSILKNIIIILAFSIVLFIFSLFGHDNLFVGIGTFLIAVTLFGDDYTINPMRHIVYFAVLQVSLGIISYIGGLNIVLGTISIFVVSIYIYYNFTYNTKMTKATGFMMGYLFILYNKVPLHRLPYRLLALAISGIVIMVLYYLIAGKKYEKSTKKLVKSNIENISKQIDMLVKGENIEKLNQQSNKAIIALGNRLINTISRLENEDKDTERKYVIYLLIKRINNVILKLNGETIRNIEFFNIIKEILEKSIDVSDNNKELSSLLELIESISIEVDSKNDYYGYNIKVDIEETIGVLKDINANKFSYVVSRDKVKEVAKSFFNKNFKNKDSKKFKKIGSLKYNFAIKSSIMLSVAYFITGIFNIKQGEWLTFTIAVVSLPFTEQINKKGLDRILGSVIGVIAFDLLFTFVKYKPILIGFLIISVFCMLSIKEYSKKAIFITFMSLSMATFATAHPFTQYYGLSLYRLGFVIIGSFIPYIVSLMFPYKLKDKTNILKKDIILLAKNIEKIVLEKNLTIEEKYKKIRIHGFIIRFTGNKMFFNNTQLRSNEVGELLEKENRLMTDLHYFLKELKKIKNIELDIVMDRIERFIKLSEEDKKIVFLSLENSEKVKFLNLLNLKKSLNEIYKLENIQL